jgi:hypothetical protein
VARLSNTVERLLDRLGSSAHGVVTRGELLGAGISEDEIRHRVHTGALIREYAGVYRVGHQAPSLEARYMAAVKACGEGAALSGRAAAYLLGLVKGRPPAPEVTAPTLRRLKGVRTRRSRRLEATICRGVPVTTPPRTLVDIAADTPEHELARACHEAGVRYRTTPGEVEAVLERRPRAKGAAKLRRIQRGETKVALSKLEARFLRLLSEAGLPLPVTNRPAGGRRVDCRWAEHRLTVELDSYTYHHSRYAWEQDRRRERQARARGDEFRRYTWADVVEDPRYMLAELRALLRE